MPVFTIKYYPVVARILLTLGGLPLVMYRAAIMTRPADWVPDADVLHRFIMEYKGRSFPVGEALLAMARRDIWRDQAVDYLNEKLCKRVGFNDKIFEPIKVIEIGLRQATVTVIEQAA